MAILAEFDCRAAAEILNAIGAGRGIPAPAGGHWTDRHALLVAACLMMATRASAPAPKEPMQREHAEARVVSIQADLFACVAWLMDRCIDLQRGVHSEFFEDVVQACIAMDGDMPTVVAVEGFKRSHKNDSTRP